MFREAHGLGMLTLGIDPVGVSVWEGRLITQLLKRFGRFVVYLEDAAGSPPAASLGVCHGSLTIRAPSTWRIGARVVGEGTRDEDWRRQFGGIDGFGFEKGYSLFAGGQRTRIPV
jgi:hypothetical protein